jgi:hypothetical protein
LLSSDALGNGFDSALFENLVKSPPVLNRSDPSFWPIVVDPFHGRCIRRRSRVGQAIATKAIAKCIRNGRVWEAESNIDLLDLVPIPEAGCGGR